MTVSPASASSVATTQPLEILTVYIPNNNADAFIQTEAAVSEITKEVVVAQLINAGVLSDGTMVAALEFDAGAKLLKADFNEPFRRLLQTMGTAGEYMIMGSVVNTFLSAFDADFISITVDGDILETGHSVYDQSLSLYPDNT